MATAKEFQARLVRAGRVDGPALLFSAWWGREIDQAVLAVTIGEVWSMAEYPEPTLGRKVWVELFRAAGFTVDSKPARLPTEPVLLWRGSPHARRRRMSWTSNQAVAERFASGGLLGRLEGRLYTVLAPPESLLAHLTGRDESEYVIDTTGLDILPVGEN